MHDEVAQQLGLGLGRQSVENDKASVASPGTEVTSWTRFDFALGELSEAEPEPSEAEPEPSEAEPEPSEAEPEPEPESNWSTNVLFRG